MTAQAAAEEFKFEFKFVPLPFIGQSLSKAFPEDHGYRRFSVTAKSIAELYAIQISKAVLSGRHLSKVYKQK